MITIYKNIILLKNEEYIFHKYHLNHTYKFFDYFGKNN